MWSRRSLREILVFSPLRWREEKNTGPMLYVAIPGGVLKEEGTERPERSAAFLWYTYRPKDIMGGSRKKKTAWGIAVSLRFGDETKKEEERLKKGWLNSRRTPDDENGTARGTGIPSGRRVQAGRSMRGAPSDGSIPDRCWERGQKKLPKDNCLSSRVRGGAPGASGHLKCLAPGRARYTMVEEARGQPECSFQIDRLMGTNNMGKGQEKPLEGHLLPTRKLASYSCARDLTKREVRSLLWKEKERLN